MEVVILIADPDLTRDQFDALLPLVSPEMREKVKCFRFFRDARNALLGDVLARMELCRVSGLGNEALVFAANAYGKPYLLNDPHLCHNISHTGHYVACVTADKPVGIDIELIRPIDLAIAERFFAPDETAYIMAGPPVQRFFHVWTKKESRIKWEGTGLSKPLPSFSVFDPAELEKLSYCEVFQNHEVICHVCASKGARPTVRVIDIVALMRRVKEG